MEKEKSKQVEKNFDERPLCAILWSQFLMFVWASRKRDGEISVGFWTITFPIHYYWIHTLQGNKLSQVTFSMNHFLLWSTIDVASCKFRLFFFFALQFLQ